ncbi:MAG: hypothetical protein ACOY71_12260 [Gemmatimonadota bacterium]
MRSRFVVVLGLGLLAPVGSLGAQAWNSAEALRAVRRAVERREAVQADTSLRSYRATAHGFLFFLAQVGQGLASPPRLVKADELDVEVYWRVPDRSKQRILAWRDGTFLPTDIAYHRDHLGVVTNNFGDQIRIGEGDEVRDAVHPLAPAGLGLYDYALGDSLAIQAGDRTVTVVAVQVRPRSFRLPLVVGTMYLDAATAELVQFRFSFTPAAYLDQELEDISVVLENALFERRYWLPYRQEIEIRRRASWFDFPARGIIRGRWEIRDYEFNVPLPDSVMAGAAIGGLVAPGGDTTRFTGTLEQAIAGVAAPVNRRDMDALRVEVEELAGTRALSGLGASRLAGNSISALVHVNRVQGLALGVGAVMGSEATRFEVRPSIGVGTSDGRVTGGVTVAVNAGAWRIAASGERVVRDFSDQPVISGVLNSFTSQEAGDDHGDYVLLEQAGVEIRRRLGDRVSASLDLRAQWSYSVSVAATPARGEYAPNPALGAGGFRVARLRLERVGGGIGLAHDVQGAVSVEAGEGDGDLAYGRLAVEGAWLRPLGPGGLLTRGWVGWGMGDLPAHRSFVLGGRGTLPGTGYRAFGGRRAALLHLEWRVNLPAPAVPLGSFATTGKTIVLAPFVAAGWTERPLASLPFGATDGLRPVAGLAAEFLMRLIRVEGGVDLRSGGVGITVDVTRDWWGLL